MKREELILLVKEIANVEWKTEKEIDDLIDILKRNVPHPEISDLIYYDELSAEEIVDAALSYRPPQL